MIRFKCPNCQTEYEEADDWLGVKVACAECETRFYVPKEGYEAKLAPSQDIKVKVEIKDRPKATLLDCQACGNKVSYRADACPQCGHPVEFGIVSNVRATVIAYQEFLLRKYKEFDKYIDPFLQVLKRITPDMLARGASAKAIDNFLRHRQEIVNLEHDIWAIGLMLTALDLEIPCPSCKSLHSIIVWCGGEHRTRVTSEPIPAADRLLGAVATGGLTLLFPGGDRLNYSSAGNAPTKVSCLECGCWNHNCSPNLYPEIAKMYEKEVLPIIKLIDRVKNSWPYSIRESSVVETYWVREDLGLQNYMLRKKQYGVIMDSDYEVCPKEKFRSPEDVLKHIDLFENASKVDDEILRKNFLWQMNITPKQGFWEAIKEEFSIK